MLDDVPSHAGWGGRREGEDRWLSQRAPRLRNLEVVRPEVVAPDADTVRLVHHQPCHAGPAQRVQERRLPEALGRGIEQPELALHGVREPPRQLVSLQAAVDRRRQRAKVAGQRIHLILHQRDQG